MTYRYQPQRTVWAAMSHLCPTRDPRAMYENESQSYLCLPSVLKLARNIQTLSEFFFKPNDSLSFYYPSILVVPYPWAPAPATPHLSLVFPYCSALSPRLSCRGLRDSEALEHPSPSTVAQPEAAYICVSWHFPHHKFKPESQFTHRHAQSPIREVLPCA